MFMRPEENYDGASYRLSKHMNLPKDERPTALEGNGFLIPY